MRDEYEVQCINIRPDFMQEWTFVNSNKHENVFLSPHIQSYPGAKVGDRAIIGLVKIMGGKNWKIVFRESK